MVIRVGFGVRLFEQCGESGADEKVFKIIETRFASVKVLTVRAFV
jgi:hypothetical protein